MAFPPLKGLLKLRPLVVLRRWSMYNMAIHQCWFNSLAHLGITPSFYGRHMNYVLGNMFMFPNVSLDTAIKASQANVLLLYRANPNDLEWFSLPAKLDIPVVLLDVDFCFLRFTDVLSHRVDMHLLRNPSDLPFSKSCNAHVFPHAICDYAYNNFEENHDRKGICYFGSIPKGQKRWMDNYAVRYRAINTLGIMMDRSKACWNDPMTQAAKYRQHIAALTCSCQFDYLNAKHFEIPATGAVLFTNGHNGVEDYLPKDTYVVYKDDCSDLVEKWKDIENNKDHWLAKAKVASEHVETYHTHLARWYDFMGLMRLHFDPSL